MKTQVHENRIFTHCVFMLINKVKHILGAYNFQMNSIEIKV